MKNFVRVLKLILKHIFNALAWIFSTEFLRTYLYAGTLWYMMPRLRLPIDFVITTITALACIYAISRGIAKKTVGGSKSGYITREFIVSIANDALVVYCYLKLNLAPKLAVYCILASVASYAISRALSKKPVEGQVINL